MVSKIKYTKPPLMEALLDIRVGIDPEFESKRLEEFYQAVKSNFPIKQVQTQFQTEFKVKKDKNPVVNTVKKINGLILKAIDNSRILQSKLDGYTFNKLKPYNGWDKFSGEAFPLWEEYKNIIKPISVKRLALRFINLIEIPLPVDDLKTYFNTFPTIAKNLPYDVSEFLLRVVLNDDKSKNKAIVSQAIDLTKLGRDKLPIIFDIDVYREVSLKPEDEKINEVFESLREFKDLIFEESLTEEAKNLIR